jgi:hypothetical protein
VTYLSNLILGRGGRIKKLIYILTLSLSFSCFNGSAFGFSENDKQALLSEWKCVYCDLIEADLSGEDLEGADLGGADLTRADLTKTNLTNADLDGANLSDANLSGAKLEGVKLNNTKGFPKNFESNWIKGDYKDAYLTGSDMEQRIADAKAAEEQRIADAKAAAKAEEEQQEYIKFRSIFLNAFKGVKPERQKEFLNIVKTHADKYAKGKSEIKRSLYRKKRMKAFNKYFDLYRDRSRFPRFLCFLSWVGTVKSLDTDKNGDAILGIDIGGYKFLNYGSQAIPMSNSLFDTVAEMEENDKVILAGCFMKHDDTFADNWYLSTHEKTEKGSMTSPTFQGSYEDIRVISQKNLDDFKSEFPLNKKLD